MKFLKRIGKAIVDFSRDHWMVVTAIILAAAAALAVGLLVAIPPHIGLGIIAGIAVFGFVPFAALSTWSIVAASFAAAGIAAAAMLVVCAVFDLAVYLSNSIDNAVSRSKTVEPKKDESSELFEIDEIDSASKMGALGGKKAEEKACCDIFSWGSSKPSLYRTAKKGDPVDESLLSSSSAAPSA